MGRDFAQKTRVPDFLAPVEWRGGRKIKDWKIPGSDGKGKLNLISAMKGRIRPPQPMTPAPRGGFTLVELLVALAIIGILAGLLLTALAGSKAKARGMFCQNNNKQLVTGWLMYADDHSQRLAYNLGGAAA